MMSSDGSPTEAPQRAAGTSDPAGPRRQGRPCQRRHERLPPYR
ncbi:hypothetical protein Ae356Ps1_6289 [Pseudonocardia sp. Ae356_Ps1]|nr:hypothetical protein Ae356Ps1_6269c [Pseudonocardia sp. Ae356_Ps1]OLL89067.1 hypothetical protein Ae356Ps1_6276c [Pseudonocardia sp. Ae356_Ps1]OLL89068.1 hypothetical protein Ae356Ps1_6277 [Pseudonocardia sp. Ae356_Ps1]OLL89080.1 hypothetical protein Ae356Ps1_6289 [Pseudonocardia sp. Ae356_Ps1]